MPSDRSRRIDTALNGYILPIAQQGRVVLDRDFNAWGSFLNSRIEADALDFVGPCGTPDNGFAISAPVTSPPGGGFWSPPQPESPPSGEGAGRDFLISGGTMYLGGLRVEWPGDQHGKPITYSYADQRELPAPVFGLHDDIVFKIDQELVYLDVTLQEVSAAEDPDLLDVALGGPDTTQRLKQRVRVERQRVEATACADAWTQAITGWASQGLLFDPPTMRLLPAVKLLVGFTQDGPSGGPCDPVAAGGFLGPDNQLIRVQVAGDSLLWSYDNASFVYRIQVASDGQTVTLIGGPPDVQHYPQTGQIVEILATSSVIDSVPDEVNGGSIVRAAAQPTGQLFTLAQPYGPPAQGASTNVLVLPSPLDPGMLASGLPLFLRVWQAQLPLAFDTPITLQDAEQNSTGLTVTLSNTQVAADGAFWQIAARPSTPQGVYPEELTLSPQWADGPVRAVCPLAVIDWTATNGPAIADCRSTFENLVTLSKRKPGCCEIAVAPGDFSARRGFQDVIDTAFTRAASVTICLAPGIYELAGPLNLTRLHRGLKLECCGGTAIFVASPQADADLFGNGLITLNGAEGVTLQGLTLVPKLVPFSQNLLDGLTGNLSAEAQAQAKTLLRSPSIAIGIHAFDAPQLTVQNCNIDFFRGVASENIDLLAAGLLLQGNCTELTVEDCTFGSGLTPSYNALDDAVNYTNYVAADRLDILQNTAVAAGTVSSGSIVSATSLSTTLAPSHDVTLADTLAAAPLKIDDTLAPETHVTIDHGLTIAPPPAGETQVTLARSLAPASTLQAAHETLDLGGTTTLAAAHDIKDVTDLQRETVAQPHQEPQANAGTIAGASLADEVPQAALDQTSLATSGSVTSASSISSDAILDSAQQLYAGTGLAQILASRSGANFLAMQRPMVAVCGIAAATRAERRAWDSALTEADFSAGLTNCKLDGALIRDNKFISLTFATLLSANAQALRLQDNDVTGSVAGLWLTLPNMGQPRAPAEGTNTYSEKIFNFEEYRALSVCLPELPVPPAAPIPQQPNQNNADSASNRTIDTYVPSGTEFSVFVTGNHVSTGQHPPPAQGSLTGASALLLWLIPDVDPDALLDSDISAIVANNHFITASPDAPSAMLALAFMQAAAVNGNIILNQPGRIQAYREAPSLWVVISESEKTTHPFAAAGNVLRGISDINLVGRGVAEQRTGWSGYNADPY